MSLEERKRKPEDVDSDGKLNKSCKLDINESGNNEDHNTNTDNNNDTDHSHVTSLFTDNPDIPQIRDQSVSRVVEKVFSEQSFGSLDIAYQIVSNVEKLGFTSMTMVQQLSIPPLLDNKDALIKSQTGSGKTLAYAVPIVHKLMKMEPRINRSDGVYAIVIVPTRELAIQSYNWFENLCKSCVWVVPGYLIGGEKKKSEKNRLKKGVNILVATPGRLIDHIHHTKSLSLNNVQYFVIDEADRLLEMGYEQNINSIVESMNEQSSRDIRSRQTIMLSATLTPEVQKLAGLNLISPTVIDVTSSTNTDSTEDNHEELTTDVLVTPENLTHYYLFIPAKLRLVTLAAFIVSKCMQKNGSKMLIFMATQDMVDFHTNIFKYFLSRFGKEKKEKTSLSKRAQKVLAGAEDNEESESSEEETDSEEENQDGEEQQQYIQFLKLHGNMSQQDRSSVFKIFKSSQSGVLLCTDVAARGLDLPEVNWIVQYNAACTIADYVHRVGRTARVNNKGSAILFLSPTESAYVNMLQDHRIAIKEMKIEKIMLGLLLADLNNDHTSNLSQRAIEAATNLQLKIENKLLSDDELHTQAKKGYISFVRSYASYPKEVREMFSFKSLHLGHYAKSFGLRDTPRSLGASTAFKAKKEMKEYRERKEKRRQVNVMKQKSGVAPKYASMSEFDSGLEKTKHANYQHKKIDKRSSFSKTNKFIGKSKIGDRRK